MHEDLPGMASWAAVRALLQVRDRDRSRGGEWAGSGEVSPAMGGRGVEFQVPERRHLGNRGWAWWFAHSSSGKRPWEGLRCWVGEPEEERRAEGWDQDPRKGKGARASGSARAGGTCRQVPPGEREWSQEGGVRT